MRGILLKITDISPVQKVDIFYWEKKHLPIKDLSSFIRFLRKEKYEEEMEINCGQQKPIYRVDFVHRIRHHIIEINGKHHHTKLGVQRTVNRDKHLHEAGWSVTRIPFKE